MLRRIISIPEGVYYRGRFRATTAWSKVSKDRGGDAAKASELIQGLDEPHALGSKSGLAVDGEIVMPDGLLTSPNKYLINTPRFNMR